MEQIRALNALEPYLALSKTANSPRAAADVIAQATSHPNTYVFAELLHMPNILALKDAPEYASSYKLLEIFAWGTWADYQTNPSLPDLSPAQHQKLLLLSLLPLATSQRNLTYPSLQSALSIPTTQALESLVTRAIYSSLVTGTLDPHAQLVNITSVAPLRDLAPGSVPNLSLALEAWGQQCGGALAQLEAEIAGVRERAEREGKRAERLKMLVEARAGEEEKRGREGGREDEGGDAMEVDGREGRTRGQKRGFFGRT